MIMAFIDLNLSLLSREGFPCRLEFSFRDSKQFTRFPVEWQQILWVLLE